MRRPKYDLIESAHSDMIKGTCKIADHNTLSYELSDGTFCYQLHDTIIVQIFTTGKFKLDSGGWHTVTTKERMNKFMPADFNLHQERGIWYLCRGYLNSSDRAKVVYYDGMIVDPSKPLMPDKEGEREVLKQKSLKKKIDAYCKRLKVIIKEDGVPMPNSGDCWMCMMEEVNTGKSWGEMSDDKDHLVSHLDEKYVHGSLIYRALCNRRSPENAAFIMQTGFHDIIIREVRNYFKRQLGLA